MAFMFSLTSETLHSCSMKRSRLQECTFVERLIVFLLMCSNLLPAQYVSYHVCFAFHMPFHTMFITSMYMALRIPTTFLPYRYHIPTNPLPHPCCMPSTPLGHPLTSLSNS